MLPVTDCAKAGELIIIAAQRPSTTLVKLRLILSTERGRKEGLWFKLNMVSPFFGFGGETRRGLRLAKRQLDFLTSALETNCAI